MAPVWRVSSFCLEGEICLDSKTTTFSAGIGENIKALRMRKQLTQKDLACSLGVSLRLSPAGSTASPARIFFLCRCWRAFWMSQSTDCWTASSVFSHHSTFLHRKRADRQANAYLSASSFIISRKRLILPVCVFWRTAAHPARKAMRRLP